MDQHQKSGVKFASNAGFTLLELMFAAGTMAFALSLLFGSLISVSAIGDVSENQTQAAVALASAMEEVRDLDYLDLLATTTVDVHGPGKRNTVLLEVFDEDGTPLTLPLIEEDQVPPLLPNPLLVRATLIWEDEHGRVYQKHVATQIAR